MILHFVVVLKQLTAELGIRGGEGINWQGRAGTNAITCLVNSGEAIRLSILLSPSGTK